MRINIAYMGNYKHIIWDWNGTLLDDVNECVAVVSGMLQRRRLPELTIERYKENVGFPVIDFYRRLGFDFTKESYEKVADEYMKGYVRCLPQCRLRQGAETFIRSLTDAGLTHSVLSAYHQRRLEEAVAHFQIEQWFIKLIGLNDYYAHSKVENGRKWIDELPYKKQEVLFVGDMLHDYETACAMGVDCVLLSCGHQSREKLRECGVPVFDSIKEIENLLFG
ncbi:MAG: HAD family hydrolase [Sedimentisphaerales bacterium]|nr:HAD family hydrolase [Sedimentisphaerales bacterium]